MILSYHSAVDLEFLRKTLAIIAIQVYSVYIMENNEELAQEIATLSAHIDAATHRLLQCIRSFDESGGWHEQGAVSCAQWLSWRVGWDPGTARERVRVARALGTLPLHRRSAA